MNATYGRDLDLNLLRVFLVVAETQSATAAAARLYLTQPAISAALKRLTTAVGAPLFAREGRGLALTPRGRALAEAVEPHLRALVDAALSPPAFDARTSDRMFRIGLSDSSESWLLPGLMRALERRAPHMRIIAVPIQFRTVGDALTSERIDLAVTVADELAASVKRRPLFGGPFVCAFDRRHVRAPKRGPTLAWYLSHEHVVVSYNADTRGIVEDLAGIQRKVRCSVARFQSVGALLHGTSLIATVPRRVADDMCRLYKSLVTAPLPFHLGGAFTELLWRAALDDDAACIFIRDEIVRIASKESARD